MSSDEPPEEIDEIDRIADELLNGQQVDWNAAIWAIPPARRGLLAQFRALSGIVAKHAEVQRAMAAAAGGTIDLPADHMPERWGPLQLESRIGSGAFGDVYRAHDPRLNRDVALKLLHPRRFGAPESAAGLLEEGRLLARVRHHNIVTVFGVEERDGRVGIVMEYIEGNSLADILAQGGPRSAEEALVIARDVSRALAALHAAGILHRDVKSRNVMRESGGRIVLMDLGVGCDAASRHLADQAGTPLYAAPEILLENQTSIKSDIYAVGVLLFHLVTGAYPVRGRSLAEVVAAHREQRMRQLRDLRPDLSEQFVRIVERALARDPLSRHGSAGELVQDLVDALAERPHPQLGQPADRPSIAVLPFRDLSPRQDQAYFSEGLAEQIIHALSHLGGLRVLARTSSFAFSEQGNDVREIGRSLAVSTVLDGSVRQAGDRVRISAHLIKVADASQIWSEQYECVVEDALHVQDEISRAIVDSLRVRLVGTSPRAIHAHHSRDMEAVHLYLMGRYLFNQGSRDELDLARQRFQDALTRDPDYALAHIGLAEAGCYHYAYHYCNCQSYLDQARESAIRAVALAPSLAEAHAIRGFIHLLDWEWEQARVALDRALALNPNLPIAHHYRAHYLQAMGRLDEARAAQERSAELDPVSHFTHGWLSFFRLRSGRLAQARSEPDLVMGKRLSPPLARIIAGQSYVLEGDPEQGIATLEAGLREELENPILQASLGWAYGKAGRHEDALRILAMLQQERESECIRPFLLAKVCAGIGEVEQAFAWLERSVAEHDPLVIMMKSDATIENLRRDRRFTNLLSRMGLA